MATPSAYYIYNLKSTLDQSFLPVLWNLHWIQGNNVSSCCHLCAHRENWGGHLVYTFDLIQGKEEGWLQATTFERWLCGLKKWKISTTMYAPISSGYDWKKDKRELILRYVIPWNTTSITGQGICVNYAAFRKNVFHIFHLDHMFYKK